MYVAREVQACKRVSRRGSEEVISEDLSDAATVPVFDSFPVRLFWGDMKNIHQRRDNVSGGLPEWQLRTLVVLPLARRINQHAAVSLKSGRRIFKQLHEVEDSIEIIAREIARQSKREK
jgi:hypothetical protein